MTGGKSPQELVQGGQLKPMRYCTANNASGAAVAALSPAHQPPIIGADRHMNALSFDIGGTSPDI